MKKANPDTELVVNARLAILTKIISDPIHSCRTDYTFLTTSSAPHWKNPLTCCNYASNNMSECGNEGLMKNVDGRVVFVPYMVVSLI